MEVPNALLAKNLGMIMLKPDGTQREVLTFALQRLLEQGCLPVLVLDDVSFNREQAKAFYPKEGPWCERYGAKLLSFWHEHKMKIPETCHLVPDSKRSLEHNVGYLILERMADYLSSGPCCGIFFATDGDPFVLAKNIVGLSTIPFQCDKDTLRGRFNTQETLEGSYLESCALHNVAHSSENPDELHREISQVIAVLRSKQDLSHNTQASYLVSLASRYRIFCQSDSRQRQLSTAHSLLKKRVLFLDKNGIIL